MRARTIPVEGPAAVFDPASPAEFIAKAGSQLVGVRGEVAVVLTAGGDEVTVHSGWVVIVPDGEGDGGAVFTTPERAEVVEAAAMTSLPVTAEAAAVYVEDDPSAALGVAGDRACCDGRGLVIRAANGKELLPEDGQVVVRYAPGDVGVMDDGEYKRWFGGAPAA